MRIIAGSLKGRRLRAPRWEGLRPSSDRLRETLFNVLGEHIRDSLVLDGCAGTGALGIEAISRGARHVVFAECDRRATALIDDNAMRCGIADRCRIVRGALPEVMDSGDLPETFDVILLDPPYDDPNIDAILSAVGERLASRGVLVLERTRRSRPSVVVGLTHVRRVTSGGSALDFYRQVGASPAVTAR